MKSPIPNQAIFSFIATLPTLCHRTDPNLLSVIQYMRVAHLKIRTHHLCGHTSCGGIKASMDTKATACKLLCNNGSNLSS
ncbi:MAG: carbonic anhydrase [Bdellovibrionota bacterium]